MARSILGASLTFDPAQGLKVNYLGRYEVVEGVDNVHQAVWLRLNTPFGALRLHPEYGNELMEIVSEPLNDEFPTKAILAIRKCLSYEPRIAVNDVKIEMLDLKRLARCFISYTVLGEPKPTNIILEVSYDGTGV